MGMGFVDLCTFRQKMSLCTSAIERILCIISRKVISSELTGSKGTQNSVVVNPFTVLYSLLFSEERLRSVVK